MNIVIQNGTRRRNPYSGFRTARDHEALALFKAGATLHTWRVASPANWWLETAEGKHIELPDSRLAEAWGYTYGVHWSLAALGKSLGQTEERVLRANLLGDLRWGKPEGESWGFDAERVAVLERQWQEVEEGLRQRAAPADANPAAVKTMSPLALSLLRLLKAKGPVYPYPETQPGFQELEQAGLVRLRSDTLCFECIPALQGLSLPRGRRAILTFQSPRQPSDIPA